MLSRDLANNLVLSLTAMIFCLGGIIVFLFVRQGRPLDSIALALSDTRVREQIVKELIAQSPGIIDTFQDPMVGYVYQANLRQRQFGGVSYSSNQWGIREKEYPLEKPKDTMRVVLLGDSYINGNGVNSEQRIGVYLEKYLREKALVKGLNVECLHIAMPGWNVLAEAAYLRRQLYVLRPDLVIHFVVPNDLDDITGVRGFGVPAALTPQYPMRAGVIVKRDYSETQLGVPLWNYYLTFGLDWESRNRYALAGEAIRLLSSAIEEYNGQYVLVNNMMDVLPVGIEQFGQYVQPGHIVSMPYSFSQDNRYRISKSDLHWNPAGHEMVAVFCYALIQKMNLLKNESFSKWQTATDLLDAWQQQVEEELAGLQERIEVQAHRMNSSIVFDEITPRMAGQIYGGIYKDGVGPYVSVALHNLGSGELFAQGKFLEAKNLEGKKIDVYVEDQQLGSITVMPGKDFSFRWKISPKFKGKRILNVRFVSEDYIYSETALREPLSFRLHVVAIQ